MQPNDGTACGGHAREGQRRCARREQRTGKANGNAHVFIMGLPHRRGMLGERSFERHGSLLAQWFVFGW